MTYPRIYADFNGIGYSRRTPSQPAVVLDTVGTLRDLKSAGLCLREGLRVRIWDASDENEDLEAEATIYYEAREEIWIAELDEAGCRGVPRRERTPGFNARCAGCGRDLAAAIVHIDAAGNSADACPQCGTPVTSGGSFSSER